MAHGRSDTKVFSARRPATVSITSANLDFQLIRAPHASPATRRKLLIKKLSITNTSGRPCAVMLSDLDSSDSTAIGRGSANAALLRLAGGSIAQSGTEFTTVYDERQLVGVDFEAGVVAQGTQIGTILSAEFEVY